MVDKPLPPLPPSDVASLSQNTYDGFYQRRAREFWGENEITRIRVEPDKRCDHEFIAIPSGAQCTKCRYGLIGHIEVREGKLFHNGDQIRF